MNEAATMSHRQEGGREYSRVLRIMSIISHACRLDVFSGDGEGCNNLLTTHTWALGARKCAKKTESAVNAVEDYFADSKEDWEGGQSRDA